MQLEFFDVPSPCVGICQSNEKGLCLGCFRSRDERTKWVSFTSDDKQKVIKRCQQRKKRKESVIKEKPTQEIPVVEQPSLLDPPKKVTVDNSTDFNFDDFEL